MVSPDNDQVFVTGRAPDEAKGCDKCQIPVLAYSQETGELRWSQPYSAEGDTFAANGSSIALSADGSRVLVAGFSGNGTPAGANQVTLAYDSDTGERVAVARLPGTASTSLKTVLPSPDGQRVYTTSATRTQDWDRWSISSYLSPGASEPTPTP